jgi:CoA:oxalate CoA-transferase
MNTLLHGVKILDLTRVLAGPFATMILGDLGAEIIKVERPVTGDDSRSFGPYVNGESGYFMSINRNKKSITLNLKSEEGKELFKGLIKDFDVIIENFRPGTMDKLGLGYDTLKEINPGIIYAAVSGFGRTGPYSSRPAYDIVIQALGGLMSITGPENGPQTRVGASIGDITAGLYGCIGVLGALVNRSTTGKGCLIDVAMLDCTVSILENALSRFFATGDIPKPIGNRHPSIVPFEAFNALDGEIVIAAGNDILWEKLCILIGRSELSKDSRYSSNELRTINYKDLRSELAPEIKKRGVAEWYALLEKAGIPGGPVNSIDQVAKDSQVKARGMIVEVEHPRAGTVNIPGNPIKINRGDRDEFIPSPELGQHNAEIFKRLLHIDNLKLEELKDRSVI